MPPEREGADRLPPQSRDAERSVLGSMLRDNGVIGDVIQIVRTDNFYLDAHQKIYDAIRVLYDRGGGVDLVLVAEYLKDQKHIEDVGGYNYLAELWTAAPTAANAEYYARIVRDKSIVRNLIHASTEILRDSYDGVQPADELLEQAERRILDIAEKGTTGQTFELHEVLQEAYDRIDARHQRDHTSISGLPCGYIDLDNLTAGLQNSELVIVAARPSVGKCLAFDSELVLADGSVATIEELYRRRQARLLTLHPDWRFVHAEPSDFIDDGVKPVYRVVTRLGRQIETTASHPFLTLHGWRPLAEVKPGDRIAVPRQLGVFGAKAVRECEVKLLAYLLGDGCLRNSTPQLTNSNPRIQAEFAQAVAEFGAVKVREGTTSHGLVAIGTKSKKPLALWLEELGLWGKDAHTKFIPSVVFTLPRPQLALFLNRLFATDGWASAGDDGGTQVGYCSVSERLARQVQHLLLRFGIVAALRLRNVRYGGGTRTAWQLEITSPPAIEAFHQEIGIFGKEEALHEVIEVIARRKRKPNCDVIPVEIWEELARAKGTEAWCSLARRAGLGGHTNLHVGQRGLSRERLARFADALNDEQLRRLASSEVYWDEIVSIEPAGMKQVYDLTIPDTHNFVANDVCVHNTSFALNIVRNVAVEEQKPVFFVSLEQSRVELAERLLCCQARVNSHSLRKGHLSSDDMQKLIEAGGVLRQAKVFIDDTPGQGMLRIAANARRLKLREKITMVAIDYLQLIEPDDRRPSRQEQVATISRRLKFLARELQIPVMALAQVNRSSEDRSDHRPRLADLRESGSLEQDADTVMILHRPELSEPGQQNDSIIEVIIAKQRNGPTGEVTLTYLKQYMRYENYAVGMPDI